MNFLLKVTDGERFQRNVKTEGTDEGPVDFMRNAFINKHKRVIINNRAAREINKSTIARRSNDAPALSAAASVSDDHPLRALVILIIIRGAASEEE